MAIELAETNDTAAPSARKHHHITFMVYEGGRRRAKRKDAESPAKTKKQFYARIVEANYEKGWQTEGYDRRAGAFAAVQRLWATFAAGGTDYPSALHAPIPWAKGSLLPDGGVQE